MPPNGQTRAKNLVDLERRLAVQPLRAEKRQRGVASLIAEALCLMRRGASACKAARREDFRVQAAKFAEVLRGAGFTANLANAAAARILYVNDPRAQRRVVARGDVARRRAKPNR